MNSRKPKLNLIHQAPFYALLVGVYPVLALLAHNIGEINPSAAWRSLGAVFVLAGGLLLLFKWLLKSWQRAAYASSWMLALFYTYGHVYNYLEQHPLLGVGLGRHRLLVPAWIVLAGVGVWLLVKKVRTSPSTTGALNLISLVLVILPLVQIAIYQVRIGLSERRLPTIQETSLGGSSNQEMPDVYYIILDAYARKDILQDKFKLDNTPFLVWLEKKGFYVAGCSQSNYAQTELSLTSSLNFNYLDALGDEFVSGSTDRSGLWGLLKHSEARRILDERGYTFVAFETGYSWSEIRDADVFLSQEYSGLSQWEMIQQINGFEALLIKTSAGILFTDAAAFVPKFLRINLDSPRKIHRDKLLYVINRLNTIPTTVHSPKFVFAHIVAPHYPFVFGPNGEEIAYSEPMDAATFTKGYRDQLIYLNQRVETIVSSILDVSAVPPIIILQADHGYDRASHEDRMKILNAYYLPGEGEKSPYPSISPVNTFRIIFNTYFGGQFPLLEDVSYYSQYDDPYTYLLIPNQGCEE